MSMSARVRRRWGLAAAVVVLTAVLGASRALALPVVDIVAGYDGFYRPGEWAPVVVTINNQPSEKQKSSGLEDFEGLIAVPSESISDPPQRYLFTREVTVPAFSSQRFFLYAKFPQSPAAPVLEFRTRNGRLLETYPLNIQPLDPSSVLMVVVSEELEPVRLPTLTGVDPIMRSTSPPDRLPEHWWGYEGVGALVLTKWSETYLRPPQEAALEQWVQSGGTVVILAGSNPTAWKGGLMDRLLPGSVTGSERLRMIPEEEGGGARRISNPDEPIQEGDVVVARFAPGLEGETMAEVEGLPLLVRSKYGQGHVVFFSIDFQNNPEEISRVFSPYWRALVPYSPLTDSRNTWRQDVRSKTQVVSRRAARPPNVFLIFLLLVGYVIAVGPLNFRYLSKRKRVEWAWFTVPAIVLFFSTLIYGIGLLTKGGQLIVREASLVRGMAGESTATIDGLIGIFSPRKERYQARPLQPNVAMGESDEWSDALLELRRSFAGFQPVSIGRTGGSGLLGFGDSRTVIRLQDEQQIVADRPLGQWDLTFLETYGMIDLEGTLEADLTFADNQIYGTLKNTTSRTLKMPILYHSGLAYALSRDLLPGDTFEIPKDQMRTVIGGPASAWGTLQDKLNRQLLEEKRFGSEDELLAAKTSNYLVFYEFFPDLTSKLFPPHSGETWLIGFGEEPEAPVELSHKADVLTHSVCYAFRLPLRPEKGRRTVESQHVHIELLARSGDGELFFDDESALNMTNTSAVVSATLPFDQADVQVDSVEVSSLAFPGASQEFTLEILDQRSLRWVDVPYQPTEQQGRFYSLALSGEASRFVTPLDGRIFLRLTSRESQGSINPIDRYLTLIRDIDAKYTVVVP